MSAIDIQLAVIPRLLRDLVAREITNQSDMKISSVCTDLGALSRSLVASQPDVVVATRPDPVPDHAVAELSGRYPGIAWFLVSDGGRKLAFARGSERADLGELSLPRLLEAIRSSVQPTL